MTTDRILTELERQKKYLARLPADFTFPLFNARNAVESQRKSGYRNTAAAAREIVDNSIEAGADLVHVVFEVGKNAKRQVVKAIAFIDNGSGMLPEMARYALSWGGGTHFDDQDFIGKFGFGLPNASINQTRLVEVYSRTNGKERFVKAWLDITEFSQHGLQTIPEPVQADLPEFVAAYLDRTGIVIDHGTVVVWVSPDRLTYRTPATLKEHLLDDFGVTYRYLLTRAEYPLELIVEGVRVEPVDPLFVHPRGRYFVPSEGGGAIKIDERYLPLKYYREGDTGEMHLKKVENETELTASDPNALSVGTVYIQVVRLPITFVRGGKPAGEETTDADRRFEIRKPRRGMAFVRAGREIVTIDAFPKSERDESSGLGRWPLLQSYAYYWGIEVRFEPALDDVFGITNDKQGIRPIEDFWRVLHNEGVEDLVGAADSGVRKEFHDRKEMNKASKAQASETATAAELAAREADVAGTTRPSVPEAAVPTARAQLEVQAQARAEISKTTLDEARDAILQEGKRRPYKIDYFDAEYGPFYKPEWVGNQIVVWINRKHAFFQLAYGDLVISGNGRPIKEAIDLLLITLSKGELVAAGQDLTLWYQTQREQVWSTFLATAMKSLGQILSPGDDELPLDGETKYPEGRLL